MKNIYCPNCGVVYKYEFEHFYGKICKCGYEIPSDGDIEIVKENRIKNNKTEQEALDSVARKLRGE